MTQEEINRINAIDIVSVAVHLGMDVKRKGKYYVTNCPWHDDHHPSLVLYPSSKYSHCHCYACDCHHSVINLYMQMRGCDFLTACHELASRYGIPLSNNRLSVKHPLLPSLRPKTKPSREEEEKEEYVITFGMNLVKELHHPDHNFWPWLTAHVADGERLEQVAHAYWLGTTAPGEYRTQPVIFWYIDIEGVVNDGKIMWFKPDGHREKYMNCMSARIKKQKEIEEEVSTRKCFFGEHLLTQRPTAIVKVVESEKTAIFMACHEPEYIWLATGGCGNLKEEMLKVLRGRKVEFMPDSGEHDNWSKIVQSSAYANTMEYSVSEDLEKYPRNTDIVDVRLGEVTPSTPPLP